MRVIKPVPDSFKEFKVSILFELKNELSWQKFLEQKENLTFYEEKDMRSFIEKAEYLPVVDTILNGNAFKLSHLKELNKKSTNKKRTVFVFDREENYVLKHIAFLLHRYDNVFPDNLYSFRKNIGVKKAIADLIKHPNITQLYSYKVDIHDYFNSVDTNIILKLLETTLKDDKLLYNFISKIITEPSVQFKNEIITRKKGIMAGVPISGFLANLYLKELDEWFKEKNIVYARYSDDIIVFAPTANLIEEYEHKIKSFLVERKLEINPRKEYRTLPNEPWEFLGFCIDSNGIDLSAISLEKIKDKMRRKSHAIVRWKKRTGACDERAISAFIRHFNRKFYDNPKHHEVTWCRWYFPTITTSKSLQNIDEYMISCIRYIATGKHTKANYNLRYEEIKKLGFKSLVNTYYHYKKSNSL